jgi:hypothetical protein
VVPRAVASLWITARVGMPWPRSIRETWLRCRPAWGSPSGVVLVLLVLLADPQGPGGRAATWVGDTFR